MFSTKNTYSSCMISGVQHKIDVNCTLLGYYTVNTGNLLPLFQDNQSVASSGLKNLKKNSQPWKMGPIDCPKTSVRNYHYLLHNNNSEQHNSHKFLTSFHGFLAAWVKV